MPAEESGLRWRKSSHSGGGNDCVEVADDGNAMLVRDSKDPDGGVLRLSPEQWRRFLELTGD